MPCGKQTNNPFFNFLRCFRSKPENKHRSAASTAVHGAHEWNKMNEEQRKPFVEMAKPYLKHKKARTTRNRVRSASRRRTKPRSRARSTNRRRRSASGSRKRVRRVGAVKRRTTGTRKSARARKPSREVKRTYKRRKQAIIDACKPIPQDCSSPGANPDQHHHTQTASEETANTNLYPKPDYLRPDQVHEKRGVKGCPSCRIPTTPRPSLTLTSPLQGFTTPPNESRESPRLNRWESQGSAKSFYEDKSLCEERRSYCKNQKNSVVNSSVKECSFIGMNCENCPNCPQSFSTNNDSTDSDSDCKCSEKFQKM